VTVVEPEEPETKPQDQVDYTWAQMSEKKPSSKFPPLDRNEKESGVNNVKDFVVEEIEIVDEGRIRDSDREQHHSWNTDYRNHISWSLTPSTEQPDSGREQHHSWNKDYRNQPDSDREQHHSWNRDYRNQPSAANAQEAPQLADNNANQKHISTQPFALPSRQAEEAAKLAERRKRFDNQRYQQPMTTSAYVQPMESQDVLLPSDVSSRTGVQPMMSPGAALPMSLTKASTQQHNSGHTPDLHGVFLPGGVLDDLELDAYVKPPVAKHRNQRDANSNGFDDADEELMKEILDDFEAI